ncbi:MAG: ferrous iron transport protein A [Candidatus Omnitrophica bacterium]|nr:ferrous iron transport protein A [Candidatus Omnitrophota bacterium]
MSIDLTQVKPGETGVIKELRGGTEFVRKIQSMGIRPGRRIRKVSSHFWRGPQTIEVDKARVAIGFGMAKKIIIELDE